ncbi:hypothetical protein [Azohydromonas lata]|uniref:Uncharacterized protein n=1 Tax=Azohydromonas lata TaxID=45677 RepID=A0ABU5IG14_9BURK|nr:hypothetical protein [Azohydromonas lata]MDZ5458066.1 hypothetical protein [Azohydromonas lata]
MEISCPLSAATPGLWLAHSRPGNVRGCMREGVADKETVDGVGSLRITPLEGAAGEAGARIFEAGCFRLARKKSCPPKRA